jgi:hypothetical protein
MQSWQEQPRQALSSSNLHMTRSGAAIQVISKTQMGHLWEIVWNPQWAE